MATADVHYTFTPEAAAVSSGFDNPLNDKLALIGAGVVGSHFAMALARGGARNWHIVDDDFVLPHNQARFVLEPVHVGAAKSDALARVIMLLLRESDDIKSSVANVLGEFNEDNETTSFDDADRIIDASASVPVARMLAARAESAAPVTSVFVNPTGTDAVLLSESADRAIAIDCVEMHYYWLVATEPDFTHHLSAHGSFLPIGGCRSPSARIPETRMSTLTGLMAGRWLKTIGDPQASITVWCGADDSTGVACFAARPPKYHIQKAGDWIIKTSETVIDAAVRLRQAKAPLETGGIVIGSWDRPRKIIYVVGIFDAPPNSKHSEAGFERGFVGIFRTISEIEFETLGNLTYVGEWHSHPPAHDSNPSHHDHRLLNWIGDQLRWSEAPALMLIAGDDGLRAIVLDGTESSAVFPSASSPSAC